MRLNEKFLEKVNRNLDEQKREANRREFLGVNVKDGIGGATVFVNNWGICDLEDLGRMIEELEMLKQAVEEETGICF